jgi:NhaP-type Na+/H+ or K+/H+ antiporter
METAISLTAGSTADPERAPPAGVNHEMLSLGGLVIFLMLMFYISVGIYIEQNELAFGHEASITIMLGMLISCIQYLTSQELTNMMKFNDNTFFYFCLPPIVFAAGFNMRRAKFFNNFKSIMIFGVLGTFVCFFSFSAMTIMVKDMGIL